MSKLFEKDFGKYGKLSGEIKEGGNVDLHFSGDVIVAARALAAKSATMLDDKIVNMIANLVGHKEAAGTTAQVDVQAAPEAEA